MRIRSRVGRIGIVIAAVVAAFAADFAYQFAAIASAYTAHMLCSGVFVSGRDAEAIRGSDLSADDLAPLRYVHSNVDANTRRVDADVFGLAERTASYRDGVGCVVADSREPIGAGIGAVDRAADAWVDVPDEAERSRVKQAIDWAFSEPDASRLRRTRAVVVLHDGRIAGERYADGFTRDTPLIGWSMAKSVVNALVGILVEQGRIAVDAPIAVREWEASDPRHAITVDQLLRMSSGLRFDDESINPRGDILHMLLRAPDAYAYAVSRPLDATPGTRWRYSSGTTNVITGALRRLLGDADYATFPRRSLFDRIGMKSAVLETDARGNFIGSSFMFATARDWGRFGQLYLNDGVWQGQRLLPEGWVAYSRTPAPADPQRRYGAHFWLQVPGQTGQSFQWLPPDTFHAIGHEGQFVSIIPSRGLVVVRLGLTRHARAWNQLDFLHRVIQAVHPSGHNADPINSQVPTPNSQNE